MPVTLVVAVTAVAAAFAVWAMSRSRRAPDPVDPYVEERWLVRWLGRHPRLAAPARAIDRQVAGGLMLVAALAVVVLTALAVGAIFDMVDRNSGIAAWDRSVAEWGSRNASSWSTTVLDRITDLGATWLLVMVAVAVGLFLGVVVAGVALINNVLKWLIDRERPDVAHLVGTSGSSFPSGHSAAAAATWFALALVVGRRWSRRRRSLVAAVAALISVAVAASRALLGVHWLTDVVAGLLVGWGWFLLSALAFGGRFQRLGEPADRVV